MEDSFAKLKEGVWEFVNKPKRYLMIVRSAAIILPSTIGSQDVLIWGYALYLLLCAKKADATILEKVVLRWKVLVILTEWYLVFHESTFDYDIKCFQSGNRSEYLKHSEGGELSDAFWYCMVVTRFNTSVVSGPMFHKFLMLQFEMDNNHALIQDQY